MILLGAAPMAVAQASRTADPILAESIAGPGPLNHQAPPFRLTGQHAVTSPARFSFEADPAGARARAGAPRPALRDCWGGRRW